MLLLGQFVHYTISNVYVIISISFPKRFQKRLNFGFVRAQVARRDALANTTTAHTHSQMSAAATT